MNARWLLASPRRVLEVWLVFLRLGLTSFGGPIAHLGYYREAFVEKRRWLTDRAYADVVALCQFLPGASSSQVGMAIGLQRAGLVGLVVAWLGFTLPSAVLLVGFAFGATAVGDALGTGWLTGLKAAAVAVVAHAVIGMAKNLAPDAKRATIALGALVIALLVPSGWGQLAAIAAAGVAGVVFLRPEVPSSEDGVASGLPRSVAVVALVLFAGLLVGLPVLVAVTGDPTLRLAEVFYRAGSLVFGGGHVVLPLLQVELVPHFVDQDLFLAGYGATQAVPGPLFTVSAYLGAVTTTGPTGIVGAAIALVAMFLPSALLLIGTLPFWESIQHARFARRALTGVNAAVVGILAAALYTPVFTAGVTGPATLALAAAAFVALSRWKAPAWAVLIGAALVGGLIG